MPATNPMRRVGQSAGPWFSMIAIGVALLVASGVLFASRDGEGGSAAAAAGKARTTTTDAPASGSGGPNAVPPEPSDPITAEQIASVYGDGVFRIEISASCGLGSGSGFAIDPHHVVTNGHVVAMSATPDLVSRTGRRITGRVIGYATSPDIAVIEVSETLSPVLYWADPDSLREGQELTVLGYPVPDTDFTVSGGTLQGFRNSSLGTRSVIKTDAPIDFGNSGGPVMTDRGRVAGIATAIDENIFGIQYVPLAVSVSVLQPQVDQMIASPSSPSLGCHRVSDDFADLSMPAAAGLLLAISALTARPSASVQWWS